MSRRNQTGSKIFRILSQGRPTMARVGWPDGRSEQVQGYEFQPLNHTATAARYQVMMAEEAELERCREAERARVRHQAAEREAARQSGSPIRSAVMTTMSAATTQGHSQYGSSAHKQPMGITTLSRHVRRKTASQLRHL